MSKTETTVMLTAEIIFIGKGAEAAESALSEAFKARIAEAIKEDTLADHILITGKKTFLRDLE